MKVTLQPTSVGWLATVGTDGRHGSTQEDALGRLLLDFSDKLGIDLEKIPDGELFPVAHKPAKRLGFVVRDLKHGCWHGRAHRHDYLFVNDRNKGGDRARARLFAADYRMARIFASPTGVFTSLSKWSPGVKANVWDAKSWALYELTDQGPVPFPTPERWAVTYLKRAKKAAKEALA